MIGTAVLSLPLAFQESGIGLGIIIACVSYLISFYTCNLIVQQIGEDKDYSDTLKKYYGKFQLLIFRHLGIQTWADIPRLIDPRRSDCIVCDYGPD